MMLDLRKSSSQIKNLIKNFRRRQTIHNGPSTSPDYKEETIVDRMRIL